jgi:hypothetical protein
LRGSRKTGAEKSGVGDGDRWWGIGVENGGARNKQGNRNKRLELR